MIIDMGSTVLVGSQAIIIAMACLLIVALGLGVARRSVAWLPAGASAVMLASSGVVAVLPATGMPTGATLWTSALMFVVWPLVAATYPDGRFVPRWSVAAIAVTTAVAIAYGATGAGITEEVWWLPFVYATALLFLCLALYRYLRRLTVRERTQARWPVLATIIELALFAVLQAIEGGTVAGHGPVSVAAANLVALPIPVALAVGLLWPTVVDVDRILRGVIAFTLVAVPVVLGFWGIHTLLLATGATSDAAAWISALLAALAVLPLARLGGLIADRIVYRGGADPVRSLRELGRRLDAQFEPTSVPETIVELVGDSLSLDGVQLAVDGLVPAASGALTSTVEEFEIEYQGARLGVLRVSPRRAEPFLTARDRAVLSELARYAAPALHGTKALVDLADARTRLVTSREEERKQLRRDLHDDLAPTLVGIGLGAAAAAELAKDTHGELRTVALQLQSDVQSALAQTREIAHGLRPPLLDDQGLVASIRQRLASPGVDAPAISITAPDHALDLPAAVELAALRIVQEAVSNVRRHAHAEHCAVVLSVGADALSIDVIDDGVGISPGRRDGMGLASIRDRAEELGGTAVISRGAAAGTTVHVVLPFRPTEGKDLL